MNINLLDQFEADFDKPVKKAVKKFKLHAANNAQRQAAKQRTLRIKAARKLTHKGV